MNSYLRHNICSFKFTESASQLVEGRYGHSNSKLIYGTFTTPTNAIAGSAVCAFSLQVSFHLLFLIWPKKKKKIIFKAAHIKSARKASWLEEKLHYYSWLRKIWDDNIRFNITYQCHAPCKLNSHNHKSHFMELTSTV